MLKKYTAGYFEIKQSLILESIFSMFIFFCKKFIARSQTII